MRKCNNCSIVKHEKEFYPSLYIKPEHHNIVCKECHNASSRKYKRHIEQASSNCDLEDIGYLYILKDVKCTTGYVKVGKTKNPSHRLKQYNSSFPEDRIEYTFISEKLYNLSRAENLLIEYLLSKYKVERKRREWFRLNTSNTKESFITSIINKIEEITDYYYQGE